MLVQEGVFPNQKSEKKESESYFFSIKMKMILILFITDQRHYCLYLVACIVIQSPFPKSNILIKFQCSFRKKYAKEYAIFDIANITIENMDQKLFSCL